MSKKLTKNQEELGGVIIAAFTDCLRPTGERKSEPRLRRRDAEYLAASQEQRRQSGDGIVYLLTLLATDYVTKELSKKL